MIQGSALKYNAMKEIGKLSNEANTDLDANQNTRLLNKEYHDHVDRIIMPSSNFSNDDTENQCGSAEKEERKGGSFLDRSVEMLKKILEQLLAPPTLGSASVGPTIIITVIIVRYLILPVIGIGVINLAAMMGLLPPDPLFRFVLLIMFALPPGVNISTMAQLFSVGQEECAMLMMWTYLTAAFALTAWSTVYMWILS
ncbi:putative membrane transport protein [Helianthus annuus]|nr:putative membrane transport protein [Helianthus annuus]